MPPEAGARTRSGGWALALLLAAVALLYLPALGYPFVSLDDYYAVVDNPGLRDLSWDGIRFLFFEDRHDFRYFPMAYLSLAIDLQLFGLDSSYFHLSNLLLHLANTALVFAFVRSLCGDRRVGLVTALLFGIHPLQVESVAWIASRKNVLFLFFFLLSLLAYVAFVRQREARPGRARLALAASVLCFAFSATAKTAAITLPAVLVLVDYQLAPRLPRHPVRFLLASLPTKLLYLPVIAFVVLMTARIAQRSPYGVDNSFTLVDWLLIGGHNLFFYVWKTFVPTGLAVFAPLPIGPELSVPAYFGLFSAFSVAMVGICAWSFGRRRALFFGSAFYLVTILPMALLQSFFGDIPILVADRYFYQSAIGLFYLVALFALWIWDGVTASRRGVRAALATGAGVLAAILFGLAAQQRSVWRGTVPLYEQTVQAYPSDAFYNRLAMEYASAGEMERAFEALDRARRAPYQMEFANVGVYLMRISDLHRRKGDYARAAQLQQAAIEATPNAIEPADARTPLAWRWTAHLYELAGDESAAAALRERAAAARVDPRSYFESLWFTMAPDAALRFLRDQVSRQPDDAVAWFYLAQFHRLSGDPKRAAEYERKAAALGFES